MTELLPEKKQLGNVFTPAKIPTVTDVVRDEPYNELCRAYGQGGFFVLVTGTTKLGKTTLVKSTFPEVDVPIYLRGQTLSMGPSDFWFKVAAALEIPAERTSGRALADKAKWGFFAKFGLPIPGLEIGANGGSEHSTENSSGVTFVLDTETEVLNALEALIESNNSVAIVIDDFHFIENVEQRREVVKCLRATGTLGVTNVLVTLPQRASDQAFKNTQASGRKKTIPIEPWSETDLTRIATQGFDALNLTCDPEVIGRLVKESYGSPQIMQQLCHNFCELTNRIKEEQAVQTHLQEPANWNEFFQLMNDEDTAEWLQTLGLGPKKKRDTRNRYAIHSGGDADGYQLLLLALRSFEDPTSVAFDDLKSRVPTIAPNIDAAQMNTLGDKLRKMHALAHKEMTASLDAYLEETGPEDTSNVNDSDFNSLGGDIAQPVFEFNEHLATPTVNILDPLFAYMLRWHEEAFLSPPTGK